MKILIQRATRASVEVAEKEVGSIGFGVVVFVGIGSKDTLNEIKWLVSKLVNLRLFEDEEGKTNRSILEVQGEVLIISQFTLYADCSQGRRPSFLGAASPDISKDLYELFIEEVKKSGLKVATGVFGAKMEVSLVNSGPFTLFLEK